MLTIYSAQAREPLRWHSGAHPAVSPIWLDLIDPSEEERRHAEAMLGTSLPTREQTSALELSSRLISADKSLRVNIPSFVRTDGEQGPSTPLGFIMTPTLLATLRYAESVAFDHVIDAMSGQEAPDDGTDVFIQLIESIVDVAADRIEATAGRLSELSQAIFSEESDRRRLLRTALFDVGAMQRQIVQINAALLGVSRVVTYLCQAPPAWSGPSLHSQLQIVHADIGSLNEFDQQLGERLQFLLDAVLGFINNDQNDIMRVLTIVSVATVPPMILAGIWGMNFKSIPEYDWPHGYAFGLTMIVVSMLVPLVVFKEGLKNWV